MEDVKEHSHTNCRSGRFGNSFNPCFNGRCKRTCLHRAGGVRYLNVSILVLMEDVKELVTTPLDENGHMMFQSLF